VISRRNHEITNQKKVFRWNFTKFAGTSIALHGGGEMAKAMEMIFLRSMSSSALAAALLTIPAAQRVRAQWSRATNANGEGSYSRRDHRGVTEVAKAVRRAICDMSTRARASTRAK
jgi:hypothetical protein